MAVPARVLLPLEPSSRSVIVPVQRRPRVTLELERPQVAALAPLFQRGVALPVEVGCSVQRLLTEELGIDPAYVEARISTVFLDGDVVDALDRATVRDGARLALSAALPGLVGATLRKGGAYAAMRSDITRHEAVADGAALADGVVHVKLFNMLIAELGPVLLAHGIVLERGEVEAAFGAIAELDDLPAGAPVFVRATFSGA